MIVKRKDLNLWERLYLPAIIGGLKITLRHFFRKKVTMQYPEEKWVVPEGYRGAPYLVKDQRSEEHTSELQSRLHLVCRLLLEKKKSTRRVSALWSRAPT